MNTIRKTFLVTAVVASAALSSAALAQPDNPRAWSFGGRNSPFINPSDVGFPRSSAEPSLSHQKHHVRENSRGDVAHY
jgi:hypothetical protein